MKYDFDKIIDRRNSNSAKWDAVEMLFGSKDVLPMWVADMDFDAPAPVIEALTKRAENGIYGYLGRPDSYYEAFINWVKRRHGWTIDRRWLTFSPGVVCGISVAILALSQPGDEVITQPPAYYPFYRLVKNNGRQLVYNPLRLVDGQYRMDFDDLKKKAGPRTRMMILCNPHNPVGRVWEKDDLRQVGEFCLENNIVLISDEIHSDLIHKGHKHVPTASISDEIAQNTIVCMAPSKTFNLAGLKSSAIIIPNKGLRLSFNLMLDSIGIRMDNTFGAVALESAYQYGEDWLEQLLEYLAGNIKFATEFLDQNVPGITAMDLEGTYLLWLDCRELGLSDKALKELMDKKAKVGLDEGPMFGPGGEGFQRLNLACPRATLEDGLTRIERAVKSM
ncbi:MAG: pyridoxal phosphate-dependent aminotransferase [Deltaproteobacteria bacterium]|nr:pyridoxal phosphate-dependent aminotransferase [Deltaproteobacteria bacterium]